MLRPPRRCRHAVDCPRWAQSINMSHSMWFVFLLLCILFRAQLTEERIRLRRFLIFPRQAPTRHQVKESWSIVCQSQFFVIKHYLPVYSRNWYSSWPFLWIAYHWPRAESGILFAIQCIRISTKSILARVQEYTECIRWY